MLKIFSASRLRILAALGLAGLAAWVYIPGLINVTASEAQLNGRAIVLRAPIDGRLSVKLPTIGDPVAPGDVVAEIVPARNESLEREAARLAGEIAAAGKRKAGVESEIAEIDRLETELLTQVEGWQAASVVRARHKDAASKAAVIAAQKVAAAANAEAKKAAEMVVNGVLGKIEGDRAAARAAEATAAVSHAKAEAERATIEAKSAENGLNLSDGQNDVPYSRQKLQELGLRRIEIASRGAEIDAVIASLETQREEILRSASVAWKVEAPSDAVVFRRLIAGGSDVLKGQEMLILVDCNDLFVEARFPMKEVANIAIGTEARIEIAGRPGHVIGKVTAARGWAAGQANDDAASALQAPDEKRYGLIEIAVAAKDLRIGDNSYCKIGAGARVSFDRDFAD